MIGEYISALANAATLAKEPTAYMVWGVRDSDHEIVGTTFEPATAKVGNESLEPWLTRMLAPQTYFSFDTVVISDVKVVLLAVGAASQNAVRWKSESYIRVGSTKRKLKDAPEHERRLWAELQTTAFENLSAAEDLRDDEVTKVLNYPAYFHLMDAPLPPGRDGIIDVFARDGLITRSTYAGWNVSNAAAVLFATDLTEFPHLARKAPRVVQYSGNSRVKALREQEGTRGYAAGFSGLIDYINGLLPESEEVGDAFRTSVRVYPELAVRELVANALLHQDFRSSGGPTIEIFEGRMEITNPGSPLVEPDRFIDAPPRSRNDRIGSLLRRMRICEERGSGWDKVAHEVEMHQLPAPLVEVAEGSTRATLFGPRELRLMEKSDRVRSVYQHACLRHVSGEKTSNSSVRARFAIAERNSARASRVLGEALEAGLIRIYDPAAGSKARRYGPYWAFDSDLEASSDR